jgi:large subunit ribosomal protein L10
VNRREREEVVANLSQKIAEMHGGFLIDFQGLHVEKANDLRRLIKEAGSELRVTKNTLLRLATKQTDFEPLQDSFIGPTAVAFFKDDPASLAKVITRFIKDNPAIPLKIKGGILDKQVLTAKDIDTLGSLPGREVLLGQLVGLLAAPPRSLVSVLAEIPRKFLRVLSAIAEQKSKT